jgi:hypothetical protein
VLRTLPGFTEEAVARTIELREQGTVTLQALAASLSPEGSARLRDSLLLVQTTTTAAPTAWVVTGAVLQPGTGSRSAVEIRIVRSGRRAAVMRHRSLPWS